METLQKVGLQEFVGNQAPRLIRRDASRVALARVLVLDPVLLLMDEPFSALDEITRERLQDEILKIWESDHKTILFVTHNVDEAAYLPTAS